MDLWWTLAHWSMTGPKPPEAFVTQAAFAIWVLGWVGVWSVVISKKECQNGPFTRHHLPSSPPFKWSVDHINAHATSTRRHTQRGAGCTLNGWAPACWPSLCTPSWALCSHHPSTLRNRYKGGKKGSNKRGKKRIRNTDAKAQVLHLKGRIQE